MPVNIHGKEYFTVAERVRAIHEDNPEGGVSIVTETVHHDFGEMVVMQTTISTKTDGPFTGEAMEVKSDLPGNMQKSYLMICATSSIGRALFAAGYGGDGEYASADEMASAGVVGRKEKKVSDNHDIKLEWKVRALLDVKDVPENISTTLVNQMNSKSISNERLQDGLNFLETMPDK
jgi:hypothetical protein